MNKKMKIIASAVGVLALSLSLATAPSLISAKEAVLAKDTYKDAKSAKFFYDKEQGWYFYEDPETGELKKLEPVETPLPTPSTPLSKDEEYAKKHPFSAQWVRVMLPRYMDQAWNNPTPENVQAYFLVQKFAVERSHEFALTARKVVLGNMLLDGSINRPLSAVGVNSANKATNDARDEILKKLTDKVGIFFFYKSTCPHCETQAPILHMAEVNLGFHVIAVSVDGGELKSTQFAHTYKDAGHAKRLGLESVPAIFLMNDKGEFDLIAASVVSFENLKERILIAAERQGFKRKNRLRADVLGRAGGVRGVFPAHAGGVCRFDVFFGAKRRFRRVYRRFNVSVRPSAKHGHIARSRIGSGNSRVCRRFLYRGGVLCRFARDARFYAAVFAD